MPASSARRAKRSFSLTLVLSPILRFTEDKDSNRKEVILLGRIWPTSSLQVAGLWENQVGLLASQPDLRVSQLPLGPPWGPTYHPEGILKASQLPSGPPCRSPSPLHPLGILRASHRESKWISSYSAGLSCLPGPSRAWESLTIWCLRVTCPMCVRDPVSLSHIWPCYFAILLTLNIGSVSELEKRSYEGDSNRTILHDFDLFGYTERFH